jgi:hypothetical protein
LWCGRRDTVEHGLGCFARLVKLLLGDDAIAEEKIACGASLTLLGVDVALGDIGFNCKPSADKVSRWLFIINEVIASKRLSPGQASSKLRVLFTVAAVCGRCCKQVGRQARLGWLALVQKAGKSHAAAHLRPKIEEEWARV